MDFAARAGAIHARERRTLPGTALSDGRGRSLTADPDHIVLQHVQERFKHVSVAHWACDCASSSPPNILRVCGNGMTL
jgi:hypothetical protein